MQESLYSIKELDRFIISNSIPFLLAFTGNVLLKDYFDYDKDFNSAFFGYKKCIKQTPLSGAVMNMHRLVNVYVTPKLKISESKRNAAYSRPTSFSEYRDAMVNVLCKLSENANHPMRKHHYEMVTTLSKGYDGCCVSALAFDAGCRIALTFNRPGKYIADSGKSVAEAIGYTCIIEGNGEEYKSNRKFWEAEAASVGDVGSIVPLNAFDRHTRDKILLLGIRGDHIWDMNDTHVNRDFDFTLPEFCMGINPEHSFNNNTITISVPFILASSWPEIYNISNSGEMKPWVIGNDYDRPIPRRILEDKGVDREEFGHKKTGVGFSFRLEPTMGRIAAKMSPISFHDFISFRQRLKINRVKWLAFRLKFLKRTMPMYLNHVAQMLKLEVLSEFKVQEYTSSPVSHLLILWGMNKMTTRYKKALKE